MTQRERRRRIAVITGTRAEYGLLTSTLAAIRAHPRLELRLIVTGMHLLRKFGATWRVIARDGFPIAARVAMQRGDDTALDQARGLGRGVAGLARALAETRSDVAVVLGDRVEAMAGALAALTAGVRLAHIHGGDVAPGDFDDRLRNAISQIADLHLAASQAARQRLIGMGVAPRRIRVVGAPGLDVLRALLRAQRGARKGASRAGAALVAYHAWGRAAEQEQRTMAAILDGVARAGLRRLIVYPNSDRGHSGVLQAIAAHVRESAPATVQVFRSLERHAYLRQLLEVAVLIGNSSSGIIEAPFAGTPVVNVGGRQGERLPGGPAIVHCGETRRAIAAALAQALRTRPRAGRSTVYGDGRAGARIAAALAR